MIKLDIDNAVEQELERIEAANKLEVTVTQDAGVLEVGKSWRNGWGLAAYFKVAKKSKPEAGAKITKTW